MCNLKTLTLGSLNTQSLHLLNGRLHADEHRTGDDAMPDVQFLHAINRGDREDIVVGQSMAGVEMQARCLGERAGRFEDLKLFLAKRIGGRVSVAAGVKFDRFGGEFFGEGDLIFGRIDE